jgi:poly(3-hydroxybutyrate) depolymerase
MRLNWLRLCGLLILAAVAGGVAVRGLPGMKARAVAVLDRVQRPGVLVPAGGQAAAQKAQFFAAPKTAPLIVDLHQWSQDERGYAGDDAPLDGLVRARGWNFIRPALAGPNRTPDACCSRGVIDGIVAAIEYAKTYGKVDPERIYVLGVSGGGYTTLCAAASGRVPARAFYAWASITDLAAWYREHAADQYGADVLQCTASHGLLNEAEAGRRSPIHMPLSSRPVHLYAGINDGFTGSVPITHSVALFNRYAAAYAPRQTISPELQVRMLDRREGSETPLGRRIGDRLIHLRRQAGPAEIQIFEGGHEILARPLVAAIAADAARR